MLAQLLNVPTNAEEWDIWSYHHRLSHDAIRNAIQMSQSVELTDYQLDPIPTFAMVDWLERNQQTHIEMDAALKSQSVDLSDVNIQNKNQLEAWIYAHYLEHQTAETTLGIAS